MQIFCHPHFFLSQLIQTRSAQSNNIVVLVVCVVVAVEHAPTALTLDPCLFLFSPVVLFASGQYEISQVIMAVKADHFFW